MCVAPPATAFFFTGAACAVLFLSVSTKIGLSDCLLRCNFTGGFSSSLPVSHSCRHPSAVPPSLSLPLHTYSRVPVFIPSRMFRRAQTGRIGGPGRREVGHGALAEKALSYTVPSVVSCSTTASLLPLSSFDNDLVFVVCFKSSDVCNAHGGGFYPSCAIPVAYGGLVSALSAVVVDRGSSPWFALVRVVTAARESSSNHAVR